MIILGAVSFSAKAGIDKYEIYLNNKLLFSQSLDKPVDLYQLRLTAANADDNIIIRYNQCNAPDQTGRGRTISLRDNLGNIVKQWKFKDGRDSAAEMVIPVRELLDSQKTSNGSLTLYYHAEGRMQGTKLAGLQS